MGFYDFSKERRDEFVKNMQQEIELDFSLSNHKNFLKYISNKDTYIRKNAYLIVARNYRDFPQNRNKILDIMNKLKLHNNELVRQTIIYTAGELGKYFAKEALFFLESGMDDDHYKVRNAVTSSLKRMGKTNPKPTFKFVKKYLHNKDPRIRREMIHGMELRGRTHPEEVLPLLKEVQFEADKKVSQTIIHVLGQISYKEGCLKKVLSELKNWKNQNLINKTLKEIIQVHKNYTFSEFSHIDVQEIIQNEFMDTKIN
ncbi:MAG: DNA alkylation repair protein [Candidatus Lokiarchaeota archaeon]